MKNTYFKFRTWVYVLDTYTFMYPANLLDEDTPDTTKFNVLAEIKKTDRNEYTYSIYGNTDYFPEFNNGKVKVGTSDTVEDAMAMVEDELYDFMKLPEPE